MNGAITGRAVFYGIVMLVLLAIAATYHFAKFTPKRIASLVSEEKQPAWRRYQTVSSLVLAAMAAVLMGIELYQRGACVVPFGAVFWLQCVTIVGMVAGIVTDLFISKQFTGRW